MACDLSQKMLEKAKDKFDDPSNEYSIIPGNKHYIRTGMLGPLEDHSFDLEKEIKKHTKSEQD